MRSAHRTGEQNRSAPRLQRVVTAVLAVSLLASLDVMAQADGRSGRDVVQTVCASCHAAGANGAPRIGDKQAWSKRASQGLSSLTRHALDGIRMMPAHGGNPTLTDLEIGRAVAYMVNQSGGKWIEPVSTKDLATERSGQEVVRAQCVKCHKDGVGGAPKVGDRNAWVPRMKLGLDNLVRSAIRGHGGMPPRGGQANLTDAELRSAIIYMFNPAAAPSGRAAEKAAPRAAADPNHRTAGGIDFYLGIVPAESLRSFPQDSVERTMHGGIPSGRGFYHVNVSLVGAKSQAPINDAQVEVRFEQPGLTSKSIVLEPMGVGAASYGNYVNLRDRVSYLITVRVQTPGSSRPVEAKFEHRFD